MTQKERQIIYYGWLGNYNLGDEAIYRAIKNIFSSYHFTPVPADTFYGFNREYSPVTIVGGSTGIPDWMDCLWPTRYSYIFGSGVKDQSAYVYDYLFRCVRGRPKVKVWVNRLKAFRYIGVRGEISKKALAEWGINSTVIGDPAFSLKSSNSFKRDMKKIAVNFGSDGILWGMNDAVVFREMTAVVKTLKEAGYDVVLVPFNIKDAPNLKKLADQQSVGFFDDWFNVESTVNLFASCMMTIGERVHSLGLSAAAGTPFIGLEYQPPCYEIAQSLGFQDYTIRTDLLSEKNILQLFDKLAKNYDKMHNILLANVDTYRRKQANFASQISQDIESLPERYWNVSKIRKATDNLFWRTDVALYQRDPKLWSAWDSFFFSRILKYLP
jgi:polysaccharide pyruvyl transferase WcaK-like protein